jgi:hypothetical protein
MPVICALLARAGPEGQQLRFGVVGMLAGHARVLRRDAGAVGAVAAGAGRHLLGRRCRRGRSVSPSAPWSLFLARPSWPSCWRRRRRCASCLLRQRRGHALHDGVLALAGLELGELLDQVLRVLPLQNGVGGQRRVCRRPRGRPGRRRTAAWPLAGSALKRRAWLRHQRGPGQDGKQGGSTGTAVRSNIIQGRLRSGPAGAGAIKPAEFYNGP